MRDGDRGGRRWRARGAPRRRGELRPDGRRAETRRSSPRWPGRPDRAATDRAASHGRRPRRSPARPRRVTPTVPGTVPVPAAGADHRRRTATTTVTAAGTVDQRRHRADHRHRAARRWTDVDTRPSVRDDGGDRPDHHGVTRPRPVDPDLGGARPLPGRRPRPSTPPRCSSAYSWRTACNEGPVTPYNDGRFVGSLQTWANCGGGATSLTVLAARSADNTYTVYAQVQLTSPNDPALQPILASIGAVPGANPGEASPPATPAVAPTPVPATLLSRGRDAGEHDGHRRDGPASVAVPADVDRRRRRPAEQRRLQPAPPRGRRARSRRCTSRSGSAEGLELWAFPYRPDPYTLLVNRGWAGDCDDGGVQSLDVAGLHRADADLVELRGHRSADRLVRRQPGRPVGDRRTSRSSSRPPTMRRSSRRSPRSPTTPTA